MVEQVQCPVCTLFLHTGMNLSDHLETHPKEQVIKALVQMTVSQKKESGVPENETIEGKPDVKPPAPVPVSKVEKEAGLSKNSSNDSPSSPPSLPAVNPSFATKHEKKEASICSESATSSQAARVVFNQHSSTPLQKNAGAINLVAGVSKHTAVAHGEISQMPTDFSALSNRFQEQGASHLHQPQNQQQIHGTILSQRSTPSTSVKLTHQIGSLTSGGLPSGFHSKQQPQRQQVQLLAPLQAHNLSQQRPPYPLAVTQQQANVKLIYSSALPLAAPQLQHFSFQPSVQPVHQKPPPAYGTAISQIRSQHNQTKQTVQPQQQHDQQQQQQQKQRQQQQLQQKQQKQQQRQQQQRQQQQRQQQQKQQHQQHMLRSTEGALPSTSKQIVSKKNVPPSASPISRSQRQYHLQQQNGNIQQQPPHIAKNVVSNPNSSPMQKCGSYHQQAGVQEQQAPPSLPPPPPPPALQPSTAEMSTFSAAVAAAAPPLHSRLTQSPYPSIFAAALTSSSSCSSSVLRYAESPVTAHYLERDNGDFIVQETPKHIVECVEKDNGEFSVIERIYQSPPSVLRIHDEEEDIESVHGSSQEKDKVTNKTAKSNSKKKAGDAKGSEDIGGESEEEFMSIDGDSEVEESNSEKSLPGARSRPTKEALTRKVSSDQPSTCAAAVAQAEATGKAQCAGNAGNSNATTGSGMTTSNTHKKSSKNTITVLSDVQLDLNEYLDLVGNILASSKIAKNQALPIVAPIPLVKVEKVEPIDDEYESEEIPRGQNGIEDEEKLGTTEAADVEIVKLPGGPSCLQAPPSTTTTASDNNREDTIETDELVANNFNDKSPKIPETPAVKRAEEGCRPSGQQATSVTYSSHATTSVIRMATTSQQHLQNVKKQQHIEDNSAGACDNKLEVAEAADRLKHVSLNTSAAEDLSPHTQIKSEVVSPETNRVTSLSPPLKKGPKKLVIKPKSNTADPNNRREEQPSSTSRNPETGHKDAPKQSPAPKNVFIKNEPSITIEATSILEQHLKASDHSFKLKEEKTPLTRQNMQTEFEHESLKLNIKHESEEVHSAPKVQYEVEDQVARSVMLAANEDEGMLIEYPSCSKKGKIGSCSSSPASFPSANSMFGVTSADKPISIDSNSTSSVVLATTMASSSNALATLRCEDEFIVPDATDVQEIVISSCYSSQSASDVALNNCNSVANAHNQYQQQHSFSDYPFSFLYGGSGVAPEIGHPKGSLPSRYQQQPNDSTTAATLASGSNSSAAEELSSDQEHRNQIAQYHTAPTTSRQWYQSVSTSNHDFEAALAADCTGAGAGDAGNYLDLDSYKRINATVGDQVMVAQSSSLSSFTAATESSLAGCTADALNIRTDEKMPAKGEISEQESNCDIENSWSQSMYGDIPVRFFKTSFPGLFPAENCWNNEEYFTVQDLSASAGVSNVSNKATKSFDFRLPVEASGASPVPTSEPGCSSLQSPASATPTTSSKKKRKRDPNMLKTSKPTAATRTIPATVTSQDLLLQQQHQQQQQGEQHQHTYDEEAPTTSAAILAGTSTAAAATAASEAVPAPLRQSRSRKVFTCVHCAAKFTRLKDRNLHMIAQHNYVFRNYRLVPMQKLTTTAASSAEAVFIPGGGGDLVLLSAGASCSSRKPTAEQQHLELQEDSKQGIVKLELDSVEQAVAGKLPTDIEGMQHILAKSELDEKGGVALVSGVGADDSPDQVFLPSLTRLYNLYHMLISFNIAALKQNRTLTEEDEKLMVSSIFFCFICREKFSTVKLYDAHMTDHPAECYTCGKKFHRWQNLSLHLKRHLGWKEFGCNICGKKFVVRSALVEHMRMHTGQRPLKCNICDKRFKRFSNLAQHRKRHGKQILRKKEFVCHCGEVLPSKARFLWHKETHDAKPKCCLYCCDRFVHANSLRRHIRLAHSDKFDYAEPMECPMCKQVFAKSSIRAHMATHSMDMQHVCAICSKSFSTKWNLKIHSWVHANRTAKPFKCEHCPKAFLREVDFKNHINAHKQIKPYTCEYCGCKFIRKYNYMRHRREHHGMKKFTCDLCKKSFHRHYYLVEHRRIHTGERPFQCTICGKSSTTKTNHNKHLKIHHSRDPFTVEA